MIKDENGISEVELSPEWKSIQTEYGAGITSTPRVEIERVDLTGNRGKRVQIPTVVEVERVSPEVTAYLTRKRNRKQSMNLEETTTDVSKESGSRGTAKRGRKKKGKSMYTNEDFDEGKKIKRMEKEINDLKKDKEKMKKEIDELKAGKNKKEQNNKEQNKTGAKAVTIESNRKLREELFPPLSIPGPSSIVRTPTRARGPAEEYEEQREDVLRVGRWDYVGGKDTIRHREEERTRREEMNASRRSGREHLWHGLERPRARPRQEGYNMPMSRRGSVRGADLEKENRSRYPRRRKTEAIVIHKSAQTETYAEILKKVKNNINIEELGIRDTRIRRTATGSLLIQIAGENSKNQADALADEMRRVVGVEAKIGRPCRKAEIRISGLDEDTTMENVVDAIIKYGECDRADVKAGGIRRNRLGEGDIWVKCPWTCANELCREGRIRIGWVGARVYMMKQAPRHCFRC